MRELNKKQKRLLDQWYNKNKKDLRYGIRFFQIHRCDTFPLELLEELEKIHDFETIVQEINNYISEK